MKQHQNVWLPDHETHLVDWMTKNGEIVDGRGTYQIKKLRASLEVVKNWRVAIDVGAHVGFFSMHLAKRFRWVHAFEPVAAHRECFVKNVTTSPDGNVFLHHCALGKDQDACNIEVPNGSSGGSHVVPGAQVHIMPLDSFIIDCVDYIKIDCEGYELQVLQGGVKTILACKPVIMVEQKPHIMAANYGIAGKPAVDFLQRLGYAIHREISGDFIMTPDNL